MHRFTKWAALQCLMGGSVDYTTKPHLIQTLIVHAASFLGFFACNFPNEKPTPKLYLALTRGVRLSMHQRFCRCNYEAKSRYYTFANSGPTPCLECATHLFFARCFCCASCMQYEELLPFCTFWLFCSLFVMCYVCFFNEANFFAPSGNRRAKSDLGARQLLTWRMPSCSIASSSIPFTPWDLHLSPCHITCFNRLPVSFLISFNSSQNQNWEERPQSPPPNAPPQ